MTATTVSTETPAAPLKLADRCDASASGTEQALVRYVKDGKTLDLCAAHHRKHESALVTAGWRVSVHDLDAKGFAATHEQTAAY